MSRQTNQHGLSRYVPDPIARQLRKECGFGCVVCGASVVDYHHIDPEFEDAKQHDPAKMALLCGACHPKVTRHQWSKEKIKEARANPICLKRGFSSSSEWFDYGTEPPTIIIGDITIYRPDYVLRMFGRNLLELKGAETPGGPVRISGWFYDGSDKLMSAVEDNCWKGPIENWDIETIGPRITIRRGPGDIALVLRTEARKALIIERLDMFYQGVRVYADKRGVYFGPPDKELYGFQGEIVNPVCCIEVSKDDGREINSAVQIGVPTKASFTNNTICGAELALCIRGQGLILGVGFRAIKVTGSLVKKCVE
ncbi:MAG: HNH endonuclease [Verrucomicrobia bacterium]|nr:HNH endonuclease [Verrucomicrobiota bacterium]